jgi:hypothetical protein
LGAFRRYRGTVNGCVRHADSTASGFDSGVNAWAFHPMNRTDCEPFEKRTPATGSNTSARAGVAATHSNSFLEQ